MGWLVDLLKDVPVSAAIKERMAHEEKLHTETKAKNVELQLQVDELTKEVAKLKTELDSRKAPDDSFVLDSGVYWKSKPEGGYEATPYCQECRKQMTVINPRDPRLVKCKDHTTTLVDLQPPRD